MSISGRERAFSAAQNIILVLRTEWKCLCAFLSDKKGMLSINSFLIGCTSMNSFADTHFAKWIQLLCFVEIQESRTKEEKITQEISEIEDLQQALTQHLSCYIISRIADGRVQCISI